MRRSLNAVGLRRFGKPVVSEAERLSAGLGLACARSPIFLSPLPVLRCASHWPSCLAEGQRPCRPSPALVSPFGFPPSEAPPPKQGKVSPKGETHPSPTLNVIRACWSLFRGRMASPRSPESPSLRCGSRPLLFPRRDTPVCPLQGDSPRKKNEGGGFVSSLRFGTKPHLLITRPPSRERLPSLLCDRLSSLPSALKGARLREK